MKTAAKPRGIGMDNRWMKRWNHSPKGWQTLLLLWAVMATPSLQAEQLPARQCQAWNTARKANLSTAVQREWLFGYVNGYRDAQLAASGKDLFETIPALEVLIEKTNAFCEQQPDAKVSQAMAGLLGSPP
ncbi:MAG: hypothetical protein EBZ60_04135 [Betaproteobacteria bacterium]|nr:hypothetical protein [Betaproteobacteria bacterium]